MASILPTTTTVPHALHLPPPAACDAGEPFQLPDLVQLAGPVRELIEQRLSWGAGKKDEVWEGVYHMSPDPSNPHQRLISRLCYAFESSAVGTDAMVFAGGNVSDRSKQWYKNYVCPDVLVISPGNPIQDRKTYWLGGPDLAVEVLSPDDESVEKLPFYAKVGTREVLHVDPDTKALTLFALRDGAMQIVGTSSVMESNIVTSTVLPVSFQVLGDEAKPMLRVTHTAKPEQQWSI